MAWSEYQITGVGIDKNFGTGGTFPFLYVTFSRFGN